LYKVAYHMAARARKQAAARRMREAKAPVRVDADPLSEVTGRELLTLLDQELQNLPERYRAPLVHCYLEGQTRDEAARQLGCSESTVNRRLEQGKEQLRKRLARRGLSLSAALLTLALTQAATSSALAASLLAATIKAGLAAATRAVIGSLVSPRVAGLANGALRTMSLAKLKIATAVLLATSLSIFTASAMARHVVTNAAASIGTEPQGKPAQAQEDRSRTPANTEQGERMTVRGRVLDADGNPVGQAKVAVVGESSISGRAGDFSSTRPQVLGAANAGADGRFRFNATRTSSTRFRNVFVLAASPNHGVGWLDFNPDAEQPQAEIRLPREQIIQGKLVDIQGQPAPGVSIRVSSIGKKSPGDFKGVNFFSGPAKDLAAWPKPATTDAQGRFVIGGVGRGATGLLVTEDDRFARWGFMFDAEAKDGAKEINGALEPARIIEGTVTYADTGRPAPNARLVVFARNEEEGGGTGVDGKADANGRFRINPFPGNYFEIKAYAPDGAPYLALRKLIQWPKATVKQQVEIQLPRGVLVRGKIIEAGSGAPVAKASLQFVPRTANNPNLQKDLLTGWENTIVSDDDGRFAIAVLQGPGHLLFHGPTPHYILSEIGSRQLESDLPGGTRHYAHAFVPLDLKFGADPHEIAVSLKRGVSVKGRIIGPDDKPVAQAMMLTRLSISPLSTSWRGFPAPARDGRFELHGLDPGKCYPVYFLDAKNKLGVTVELSGKQAGQEVTARLLPCGAAAARFLDAQGKPIAKQDLLVLEVVVTTGPHRYDRKSHEQGKLAADAAHVVNIDRLNHWHAPPTDAEGRTTFPALIPGATYRIVDVSDRDDIVKKEFKVEAGKKLELGDIVFKKWPR
jgi:protocatechuate 3,4-dioxygenase beta subunit